MSWGHVWHTPQMHPGSGFLSVRLTYRPHPKVEIIPWAFEIIEASAQVRPHEDVEASIIVLHRHGSGR
jgi:hypothetical protein